MMNNLPAARGAMHSNVISNWYGLAKCVGLSSTLTCVMLTILMFKERLDVCRETRGQVVGTEGRQEARGGSRKEAKGAAMGRRERKEKERKARKRKYQKQ